MRVKFLRSLTQVESLPVSEKPQIALVGRSNVGKSSLINHLTQQKNLARVSTEPGRTQTINLYEIDDRYFLVDLPGYGYAKTSKTARQDFFDILNDYLALAKQLRLVFLIIDARMGPTDSDREMLDYLLSSGIPIVMILNKIDKLSNSEIADLVNTLQAAYPEIRLLQHSNISGKGRREILETIRSELAKA